MGVFFTLPPGLTCTVNYFSKQISEDTTDEKLLTAQFKPGGKKHTVNIHTYYFPCLFSRQRINRETEMCALVKR